MEADFESVEGKLRTLSKSDVATQFDRFSKVLNTFRGKYTEFKNEINRELQTILPRIRGGGSSQQDLTDLVDKYHKSVYNRKIVEDFLSIRTKEIETVENIMDIDDGIVVDDGNTADGNICTQVRNYCNTKNKKWQLAQQRVIII